MKKILLALLTLVSITCFAQTTGYLRYDSVKIMKQNGNSNLIIENATRDSLGFLYNYGSGRTRFEVIRAVPGGIKVGTDTIPITSGSFVDLTTDQTIAGVKSFAPAVTAAAALARGTNFQPTLTAAANSDVLVAVDITPTYDPLAFTGVQKYGLRVLGKAKFGTGQSSTLSYVYIPAYDTITSTTAYTDRGLHVDRRTVLPNSYIQNPLAAFLVQGYLKPDSLLTFQSALVDDVAIIYAMGGGFLDKSGSVTSIINGGTTAALSPALTQLKFATDGISRTIGAFMANTKYIIEADSPGSILSYSDIVLGATKNIAPTLTNRYGLYIDPIDHANVTNPYAIYQAGTTDTSVFAGKMRFTGLPAAAGTKAVRIDANGYLSTADTTTGSGSGANTALSNLSAVAINTSLVSDADNTDDLGSSANSWKDIYSRSLILDGSTSGTVTINSDAVSKSLRATTLTGEGYVMTPAITIAQSANTLTDNTSVQPVFGSSQDVFTLQGSTLYEIDGYYDITSGTTSHVTLMGFTLAGGATINWIKYTATSYASAINTTINSIRNVSIDAVAPNAVNASNTGARNYVFFKGFISMDAGGTVQPVIQFSVQPSGTAETNTGSYIKFIPVGVNSTTTVGPIN